MKRSPSNHLARLLAIAAELQSLSLPGPLLVFGSMAAGAARPGDIDVVCDLRGLPEPAFGSLSPLLSACRRHYGWVDAFLLTEHDLLVRSDEATAWVMARNARGLRESMAAAVPLAQVIDLYQVRVAELSDGECAPECLGQPHPDEMGLT